MINSGDIPRGFSLFSLNSHSMADGNCGGGSGNINEKGVPLQEILYASEVP